MLLSYFNFLVNLVSYILLCMINFTLQIKHKKSGPAMTLKVTAPDESTLDLDLVPAFQFGHLVWPSAPVKALPDTCKVS